jgi:hypothetical protein
LPEGLHDCSSRDRIRNNFGPWESNSANRNEAGVIYVS